MSYWGDEVLHHKYDPLPEDAPRHRKKAKKNRVRSNHKHEYEKVAIDAGCYVYSRGKERPYLCIGKRCRICGKLSDVKFGDTGISKPPEGMRLYKVDGLMELLKLKYLSDHDEVF